MRLVVGERQIPKNMDFVKLHHYALKRNNKKIYIKNYNFCDKTNKRQIC